MLPVFDDRRSRRASYSIPEEVRQFQFEKSGKRQFTGVLFVRRGCHKVKRFNIKCLVTHNGNHRANSCSTIASSSPSFKLSCHLRVVDIDLYVCSSQGFGPCLSFLFSRRCSSPFKQDISSSQKQVCAADMRLPKLAPRRLLLFCG